MFGTLVSDMQSGVSIANNAVTGTLKYLDEGDLVTTWGEGNFLAVKFDATWADYDTVRAYILPSAIPGSEPGNLVTDPDHNAVLKVTDAATQVIKVVATKGTNTRTETYKLIGLTCL